ncbi:MAG: glycosyltransferase [Bacilli bacterium]|uniref:glycosyltransferase n=1 Tax=Anaerorhabdus sp. TaxID=1872524 RepID=UPI002FC6C8F8
MRKNSICAGIVTFNPDINRLGENVKNIISQVSLVIIVDNCSANLDEVNMISSHYDKVMIVKSDTNYGIARALNTIANIAAEKNFKWVLTLDQDSKCAPDLIENYLPFIDLNKVGQISCLYQDINFREENIFFDGYREVSWCITSGALLNVNAWKDVKGFDEDLFIDAVDYDLCLSLKEHGYKIIQVGFLGFYHEIGEGKFIKRGLFSLKTWNHSSFRRYYSTRNMLIVSKKHNISIVKTLLGIFKHILMILIFEDKKIEKLKAGLHGTINGLRYKNKYQVSKMKINIIIPGVGLTGGIRVIFTYAQWLTKSGNDLIFYTPIKAYNVKNSDNELINLFHVFFNSLKRMNSYLVAKNHLKVPFNVKVMPVPTISNKTVRDADVTIATAWPTSYSVANLDDCKGKKLYFIQGYEIWNNEQLGKQSYELKLNKVVISKWINNQIRSQIESYDFPIVYNGIDDIFLNSPFIERKLDKKIKFVMLYNILPIKGVDNGIKAFLNVKQYCINIELTMFGLDKHPQIPDWITYIHNPSRNDLLKLYSESDVLLFPALEEGWGLTPLEAMATGCIVVGTNVGCMLELGVHNQNVLLSEPGDVDGMIRNIKYLIENPNEAIRISKNGYNSVQYLTWEKCAEKFEKIIRMYVYEPQS